MLLDCSVAPPPNLELSTPPEIPLRAEAQASVIDFTANPALLRPPLLCLPTLPISLLYLSTKYAPALGFSTYCFLSLKHSICSYPQSSPSHFPQVFAQMSSGQGRLAWPPYKTWKPFSWAYYSVLIISIALITIWHNTYLHVPCWLSLSFL